MRKIIYNKINIKIILNHWISPTILLFAHVSQIGNIVDAYLREMRKKAKRNNWLAPIQSLFQLATNCTKRWI